MPRTRRPNRRIRVEMPAEDERPFEERCPQREAVELPAHLTPLALVAETGAAALSGILALNWRMDNWYARNRRTTKPNECPVCHGSLELYERRPGHGTEWWRCPDCGRSQVGRVVSLERTEGAA